MKFFETRKGKKFTREHNQRLRERGNEKRVIDMVKVIRAVDREVSRAEVKTNLQSAGIDRSDRTITRRLQEGVDQGYLVYRWKKYERTINGTCFLRFVDDLTCGDI